MSSTIDNHEIIDTLKKEGWTLEEVVKSVYYFWEYIHIDDYKWTVNPGDLVDHLRNTAIDYDSSYVSICQNGEKVDVNMKSMVGKNNAKMLNSPAIWKIQKNIKGYYKVAIKLKHGYCVSLRDLLRDYIRWINEDKKNESNNENVEKEEYISILPDEEYDVFLVDKEMKSYIDVLTMFKVCDYKDIKSIYNLGNNSFIIEINNDTNDQVMHLQLNDRTIDEWVTNGESKSNKDKKSESTNNLQQIYDLFHDIAKILVKIGVKSLTELKRIKFSNLTDNVDMMVFVLDNGNMYDVIRGNNKISVLELEEDICEDITDDSGSDSGDDGDHSSDSDYVDDSDSDSGDDGDHSSDSDYVDDDSSSDDLEVILDDGDDDDGKYVDKVDFTTNITFVDDVLEDYPDEPINTAFERQNMVYGDGPHHLSKFNECMSDDRVTTILAYIQDNLIHWKCNDILEIKYIRFYPKSRNYRIVFENGSEIEAGKILDRYFVSIVNQSPFKNEPNVPYYRRPVNALKTIADLFERCNITNISSVYQIDINGCEFVIHLVNDTRIVTYKSFYYDGSIVDPNVIKVVKNKNINKYTIPSKDDVDLRVYENIIPNKLDTDDLFTIICGDLAAWDINDIDEVKCIKYYANETEKFHAGSFVVYLSNGNVLRSTTYEHNGDTYRNTSMIDDYPREPKFLDSKKNNVSDTIMYVIKILTGKFGIYYPNTIDTVLFKDENFIINTTDGLKIVSNKVYGLGVKLEEEEKRLLIIKNNS